MKRQQTCATEDIIAQARRDGSPRVGKARLKFCEACRALMSKGHIHLSQPPREVMPYTPALDERVRGADNLPVGTGARYLQCSIERNGTLLAIAWRRTMPKNFDVLIDFRAPLRELKKEKRAHRETNV